MKKRMLSSFFYLGCSIACASPSLIKPLVFPKTIYTTISAGIDYIRTNGNQSLVLLTPYQDYYTGSRDYKTSASLGLGVGLEQDIYSNWLWQAGLAGYLNSSVRASGHRWEFNLPDFDNFTYRYRVRSSRVVATGKLLSTYQKKFHPYFSGELGLAFNRASGYSETPLIAEELPMEPFRAQTRTNLSWGLRLGVGYQFVNLGKASLGMSPA